MIVRSSFQLSVRSHLTPSFSFIRRFTGAPDAPYQPLHSFLAVRNGDLVKTDFFADDIAAAFAGVVVQDAVLGVARLVNMLAVFIRKLPIVDLH